MVLPSMRIFLVEPGCAWVETENNPRRLSRTDPKRRILFGFCEAQLLLPSSPRPSPKKEGELAPSARLHRPRVSYRPHGAVACKSAGMPCPR